MPSRTNLPTDAAARKAVPIATGVLDYFPDALAAVAECSRVGNDQHNPGEPLHWAKEKSTDQADCIVRHLIERGTIDTDGVRHSTKVAWRALANLQIELDNERKEEDGDTETTDAEGTTGEEAPGREEVLDRESERLALWGARDCVQCNADRGSDRPSVGVDATRWFGEWYREDRPARPEGPYDWSDHLYD